MSITKLLLLTGVLRADSVYSGSSFRLSGNINCEGELYAAHFDLYVCRRVTKLLIIISLVPLAPVYITLDAYLLVTKSDKVSTSAALKYPLRFLASCML